MFVDLVGSTALSPARPRGDARGLRAYQNAVAGASGALRGPRRQVHGRRRAGLLRLAPGARGRGRAGGPGRPGDRRGRRPAGDAGRASRSRRGSGSRPAWWWSATSSARARRRRRRWSARPRTSPPGCRRWPSRAGWWSRTARGACWARCSSLRPLGPRRLKGFAEPVPAFAGARASAGREPLRGAPGGPARPLVGRDQELALLLDRWRQAKAGEGQAVLLVGEPGIGKSRLVRALLDAARGRGAHGAALPVLAPPHRQRALAGDRAARARRRLSRPPTPRRRSWTSSRRCCARERRRRRGGAAARGPARDRRRRPLPGRCGLTPAAARGPAPGGAGRAAARARQRGPVLMVLEDAHWSDPTTLELVEQALDRIAACRCCCW